MTHEKHGHRGGKHRRRRFRRAPVMGGHWRLRQLRQFDFGFQHEEDGKLRVVIPLPGIGEGGLEVKAKEQILLVKASVKEELRQYSTRPDDEWEIVLQDRVVPESAKASYKSGILFVDLELADPGVPVENVEMEEE